MRPSNDLACAPPTSSTLDVVVPATLVGLVGVGLGILLGRTVLAPKQPAATPAPTPTATRVNPGGYIDDSLLVLTRCWDQFLALSAAEQGAVVDYVLSLYVFVPGDPYLGNLRAVAAASRDPSIGLAVQVELLGQSLSSLSEPYQRQFCEAMYVVLASVSAPLGDNASFSNCWSVFQSFSVAQQGGVAAAMLRRFGLSGYVQVQGDAALGARLRAISQAAQAKVGSTTLQPKFVNERLRALQVALRAAGQDRRDAFCRLIAQQAPYASPPVPTSSPAWTTKSPMDRPVPTPTPAYK